jgi:hypothetical protein
VKKPPSGPGPDLPEGDNGPIRRIARAYLRRCGYDASVAESASAAMGAKVSIILPERLLSRNVRPLSSNPCDELFAPGLANLLLSHGQTSCLIWIADTKGCSAEVVTLETTRFDDPDGRSVSIPAFSNIRVPASSLVRSVLAKH